MDGTRVEAVVLVLLLTPACASGPSLKADRDPDPIDSRTIIENIERAAAERSMRCGPQEVLACTSFSRFRGAEQCHCVERADLDAQMRMLEQIRGPVF
ncbi:MAG: hypothetical protein DIU56_012875 [Pseudomonadota bacterium]|jgi:hypothetical protein|nr:MAG: hypothetical protein DIU56_11830 [Pseudomonadota bacterium]